MFQPIEVVQLIPKPNNNDGQIKFSKEDNNETIVLENLIIDQDGAHLRNGFTFVEKIQLEDPAIEDVVCASSEPFTNGVLLAVQKEFVLQTSVCTVVDNSFSLELSAENWEHISTNGTIHLKTGSFSRDISDWERKENNLILSASDTIAIMETFWDVDPLSFVVSVDILQVYHYKDGNLLLIESEKILKASPIANFYLQGKTCCLVTSNNPIQQLRFSEDDQKFLIKECQEFLTIPLLPIGEKGTNCNIWYDETNGILDLDIRPKPNAPEIPSGVNLNITFKIPVEEGEEENEENTQAITGTVKQSIIFQEIIRKSKLKIVFPAREKVTVIWDNIEDTYAPVYKENPEWLRLKEEKDFWHNQQIERCYDIVLLKNDEFTIDGLQNPFIFFKKVQKYSFVNKATKEAIEPLIPVTNWEQEYNRFYHIEDAVLPPKATPEQKRAIYRACRLRGNKQTEVIPEKTEIIEREEAGDNTPHTLLKLELKEHAENMEYAQKGRYLEITNFQIEIRAPILQSLTKHKGFYYGIGKRITETGERYNVFRTAVPGNINSWFDPVAGDYCFSDVSSFFGSNNHPVALHSFRNNLYVFGTKETQVWDVANNPVGTLENKEKETIKIALPAPVRVLGRMVTTLNVGVRSKNLFFTRDNLLTLITDSGLIHITDNTLNQIPQIVRSDVFKEFLTNNVIDSKNIQKMLKSGFVFCHPDYTFIKPNSSPEGIFFAFLPDQMFSVSYFNTNILKNVLLLQNTIEDFVILKYESDKRSVIFYRYRHGEHIYYDGFAEEKTPISFKWVSQFKIGAGLWDNHKIRLQVDLRANEDQKFKVCLCDPTKKSKKIEKTVVYKATGERLPDNTYGYDFFFQGIKTEVTTPARITLMSGLLTVEGISTQPFNICKTFLYGESINAIY